MSRFRRPFHFPGLIAIVTVSLLLCACGSLRYYAQAAHGQEVFFENGCGACHRIGGTPAQGVIGPDLTHVGSRHSLAAATLPNDAEAFARWITDNQHIKPDNLMPPFRQLSAPDLAALAAYLDGLE